MSAAETVAENSAAPQPVRPNMPCRWQIRGKVVHGHGRGGTQLGFPTANIELDEVTIERLAPFSNHVLYGWGCVERAEGELIPECELGPFPVSMSVGYNPYFQDKKLSVEAYFVHTFAQDFYDRIIRLYVLGVIREQRSFNNLQELIDEIHHDVDVAKNELATVQPWESFRERFVQPSATLTAEETATMPFLRFLPD